MAKKSLSQKRALRQQQEREALNNILNVFLLGLVAECYLFIVYRGYVGGSVSSLLTWNKILHVIFWISLAVTVGGGVLAYLKRKNTKLCKLGVSLSIAGLFLAVSGWVMIKFFDAGVITMCIAVPVLTILGLIYFLYQHECFLCTTLLAGSIFTVWVCERGMDSLWSTIVAICAIAVVAGLIVVEAIAFRVRKNDGMLCGIRVFSVNCNYTVVFAVCALSALAVLVSVFVPTIAYYLLWALGISLFAELAYYTAKLM